MATVTDNGFTVQLSSLEMGDLIAALNELEAMRAKFTYPGWWNGYDVGTAERATRIHRELQSIAGECDGKTT